MLTYSSLTVLKALTLPDNGNLANFPRENEIMNLGGGPIITTLLIKHIFLLHPKNLFFYLQVSVGLALHQRNVSFQQMDTITENRN